MSTCWGERWWPQVALPASAFCSHLLGNVKERARRTFQWPSFLLRQHVLRYDCGQLGAMTERHASPSLENTQAGDGWYDEESARSRARPGGRAHRAPLPPGDVRSQGKFCGIRRLHAAPDPKVTLTSCLELGSVPAATLSPPVRSQSQNSPRVPS